MFDVSTLSLEELCSVLLDQIQTTKPGDIWRCQDLVPLLQWKRINKSDRMIAGGFVFGYSLGEGKGRIKALDKNSQNQQRYQTL